MCSSTFLAVKDQLEELGTAVRKLAVEGGSGRRAGEDKAKVKAWIMPWRWVDG